MLRGASKGHFVYLVHGCEGNLHPLIPKSLGKGGEETRVSKQPKPVSTCCLYISFGIKRIGGIVILIKSYRGVWEVSAAIFGLRVTSELGHKTKGWFSVGGGFKDNMVPGLD
jgi:hypothetical protein